MSDAPALARPRRFLWPRRPQRPLRRAMLALLLTLLVTLLTPWTLYFYHLAAAGRAVEHGLVWPTPRRADSLPQARDAAALAQARAHLARAQQWRPTATTARQLGAIAAAEGRWPAAIAALEQARALEPANPLASWELGLVYEQLDQEQRRAPSRPLIASLPTAHLTTPKQRITTSYCQRTLPSCYIGRRALAQPYAGFEASPPHTAQFLLEHPPALITTTVRLPAGEPALRWLLGSDPAAHDWGSDGATFEVTLVPRGGVPVVLAAQTVDGQRLRAGWTPGGADLSSWAGQVVELRLATSCGPADDCGADWVGWGDLSLTTRAGWQAAERAPSAAALQAWRAAGATPETMQAIAASAVRRGDYALALRWYARTLPPEQPSSTAAFLRYRLAAPPAAAAELAAAVALDQGWLSADLRFQAWYLWGRSLYERGQPAAATVALGTALAAYSPGISSPATYADTYRLLGVAALDLKMVEVARGNFEQALQLDGQNMWAQIGYAMTLARGMPPQPAAAEAAFTAGLALAQQNPAAWTAVIRFWQQQGQPLRAQAVCVAARRQNVAVGALCST